MDQDIERAKLVIEALGNAGTVAILGYCLLSVWRLLERIVDRLMAIVESVVDDNDPGEPGR